MKDNQSLHITIKQPPNPNPIKTLGIFDDPDNPAIPQVINSFLQNPFETKSKEFTENVKDEALKLLTTKKVIAVARQGTLDVIYLQ